MLKFFEEISAIPRGSGNEKGIADYLCKFAAERGLFCVRDELHNVFIRREADVECSAQSPVSLQGHTDMVCDKEAGCEHDFEKDPLKLYVENGYLRAKGTTLGGDDGAAVAAMLALLDGAAGMPLPELECVFTVQEETGLGGALTFDWSLLHSRKMINLDSEQDGEAVVGCCGGERCYSVMSADKKATDKELFRIEIGGLAGGHSGTDIDKGRANANIIAGHMIKELADGYSGELAYICGGSKDNAIARECVFEIACDKDALKFVSQFENETRKNLSEEDKDFEIKIGRAENSSVFSADVTHKIADFITMLPCGVISMCNGLDLPQSSANLGVIRTADNNVQIDVSVRSSVAKELDEICENVCSLADKNGMSCERNSRYPGWERRDGSHMEKLFRKCYAELFDEDVNVAVIHAGLECGIISGALPDMDIISIGPTMKDIHSPSEALELASCEHFWRLLCKMITE